MKTLWFRSYQDACKHARNSGLDQKPEKREVWLCHVGWEKVWSLLVTEKRSNT